MIKAERTKRLQKKKGIESAERTWRLEKTMR